LDPQFEDGYINLAAIQTSLGHYDQTLQTLDNLLSFAPNNALALAAKAVTLKHFDRLDEALSIAKQALEIAPESADIHNAIGQILQRLNRFDEALEAYDRAANLPGIASESAQVNRAIVLNETGSKSEALAMLDQTIKAFPRSASAWFSRADLKTFTADDPEIGRMESLLSSNSEVQSFSDRMALHFALGKAYLDVGAGEDAFRHLNQGNGMKRSTVSFDIQKTVEWMQSFSTVFSKEFMESRSGGHPSTLPIFIVGVPRSGTTLIEQILASHPDVYGAGELRHLQSVVDQIKNYPSGVMSTTASDYSRLGQIYHDRVMSLAGDHRHVIDKMPANFMHLGVIQLALPNARIIHCRRDPVDTCLSCYSKLFNAEQAFTYDLNELGLFYQAYQRMMDHWRTIMSPDRFIEVDYESVVDDVDTQARRLLEFLGLPWDETCTRFYENKRSVRTASVNQVRQPIYKTSSGRWKKFAPQLGPLLSVLDVKSR
jgi:tetratricopeptide (TPR) repeat protein